MVKKWCVVDAEGDSGKLGLLGVAFYSDEWQCWVTDKQEIIRLLYWHAERKYTFVAHNASYDLGVIFWQLKLGMRAYYYNKQFNRGEWKYDTKKPAAQLWDSFNLAGNVSVASLGKALGLHKYSTPQKLKGIDPDKYEWKCDLHDTWECEACYAIRDAEIVYRYMEYYTIQLANWSVNPARRIAGAAMDVWKSLDRPEPISIKDGRIRELGRQSYFGGRVECFKLGHFAPVYTADVASMYPSVMLDTVFPNPQSMTYVKELYPSDLPLHLPGVSDVLVSIPPSYIPSLPFAQQGVRLFPIGKLRGVWTHVELQYAMSQGAVIHRVYASAYSLDGLHPFTTFVGTLWELRNQYKQANDPRAQVVKVLLNSAYGRLGMHGDMNSEIVEPMDPTRHLSCYNGKQIEVIGGHVFIRSSNDVIMDKSWLNVVWASTITAAARVRLHKYLTMQGTNVIYCDTDSVFSTVPIVGLSNGLGALTDNQEYANGWIVGPKLYCLETLTGERIAKAKGVPRSLAYDFLTGKQVLFEAPVKPRTQSRHGKSAGTWIQIQRERGLTPHRRTPTNPAALSTGYGWSDTVAPYVG